MKKLLLPVLLLLCTPALAQGSRGGTFPQRTGEAVFKEICAGCHMADAKGAVGAGAYPALARNPNLESAGYPVGVILHGQKAMPWFDDELDDEQVAGVVNYIRSHFGNRYTDKVTPADVKAMR